jgi:hypothetical protein
MLLLQTGTVQSVEIRILYEVCKRTLIVTA